MAWIQEEGNVYRKYFDTLLVLLFLFCSKIYTQNCIGIFCLRPYLIHRSNTHWGTYQY